ncbi:AbfB domain-containing protein [Oharaeibacter diazotrophicus]|uniref:Glyoxal oxidase-like protein n=1 Tax=Oharaeibacter diazotrophicus TaxID=1920512 RepID=A0A4R6RJT0_9HYPH|nr:AbfB domain-containing protein [Oharaeibacter diazotrophicus]TDP86682.1 glyoxal oxidase-like protein [Oharaeibacter diazotrophicus]BBE71376.1 alpha-L-arabinofuranosidase B [Pleomorphomonas sp. SM30]GLS78133.1 hypothetical protein GCM10007904_34700 [Oharaeibacter diazotrophicus]
MRSYDLVAAAAVLAGGISAAHADVAIPQTADPLLANLAIPADAPQKGMWSKVSDWPLIGLHLALMPSGVVMSYGTPLGNGVQDGRTFDIWTPEAGLGAGSHYTFPNAQQVDSFCSAATYLTTGAMLITGGNTPASGYSAMASTRFDAATLSATKLAADLSAPRWYGSMITLADGRALVVGGGKPYEVGAYGDPAAAERDGKVSTTPEVYTEGAGWKRLDGAKSSDAFGATNNRWWYPRLWVAPDGKVFGISSDRTWKLDPAGNGAISQVQTFKSGPSESTRPNIGPTSTAVMYAPGKILQVGGNGLANGYASSSSKAATVFDINGAQPVVTETAPMTNARQWANATVLPNGTVAVTGGTRYADTAGDNAVYDTEIWSPATGRWTLGAKSAVYRGYHSAVILLPNGALLSTGGGVPGPVNNFNAEIYYPPYLFRASGNGAVLATRPTITAMSGLSLAYGAAFTITSPEAASVTSGVLIGLSSTTHSFNSSQRLIPLSGSRNGTVLTTRAPASAAIAPPGYYLLHILNGSGVPSRGVIVSIGLANQAKPGTPATTVPTLPLDGAWRSLVPTNFPTYRVRHAGYLAGISAIGSTSSAVDKLDSAFAIRKGLGDAACYSFESRNFPGYFLRHQNYRLRLDRNPGAGDAGYAADATFCARRGMTGTDISLEAKNYPGYFLRHRNYEVWLDRFDGTPGFKADSTFSLAPAL